MNRRIFVSTLLPLSAALLEGAKEKSLRELGARKNLLVGSAVSYAQLQTPPITALLAQQASILIPENEMKWASIHPEQDRFDFRKADALLSFAARNNQRVRGHNLCWHEAVPAWFKQVATPNNAESLLRQHVATVAGRYAGRIHSWDVVNEAINVKDGRPDGLRNSIWLELLGPKYIDIAYRAAAQADSRAILTYNDYDLEMDTPEHQAKRQAVIRLLTSMRDSGVPIGALGLQSHLRAGTQKPEWSGLHRLMDKMEQLHLQIFVTELDVNDGNLPGDIAERDRKIAHLYYDYLHNVLRHGSVKAVLTWGITDRNSWLNSPRLRKGGKLRRPLPFDADLKPKPAFYAMCRAIEKSQQRTGI